ncbi:hypothetical protein [Janthinobacterium violaceinigrum]|uniref:Uncharacterized protein n=1 Tax=Janthinobacterium violaceinigrum TaxID=2654252 RepID=A0A6I1IP86_9BURK|nr:hypothetical protein [Janthinobacterium violaceinigrum]KAB8065991.1 hypothetical protein GCN75_04540 [Janthinobacterium violaceinigrum]
MKASQGEAERPGSAARAAAPADTHVNFHKATFYHYRISTPVGLIAADGQSSRKMAAGRLFARAWWLPSGEK